MSNKLNTLTMSNKLNTLTMSNVFEILHRVCEMERSNRSSSSQLASREIILILEKSLNLHLIQFDAECKQSNGEEISYHFDFNQIWERNRILVQWDHIEIGVSCGKGDLYNCSAGMSLIVGCSKDDFSLCLQTQIASSSNSWISETIENSSVGVNSNFIAVPACNVRNKWYCKIHQNAYTVTQ